MEQIAFGGGCHWCTEAVFQSLNGVVKVDQGYVASTGVHDSFSEAVIVHYDNNVIDLQTLIEVHLHTHQSSSNHSRRDQYRSAVYGFSGEQLESTEKIIAAFQPEFEYQLITKVLPFLSFKPSREQITNYYYSNPEKPFCETYIKPKLRLLLERFSKVVDARKIRARQEEVCN